MIRHATPEDLPALVTMGRDFVSQVGLFVYDETAAAAYLRALMASDEAVVLVDEDLTGMIGGQIAAPPFAPMFKSVRELFWWSEGTQGVELLRALERWGVEQGVGNVFLTLANLGDDRRTRAVIEHGGYSLVEQMYLRVF